MSNKVEIIRLILGAYESNPSLQNFSSGEIWLQVVYRFTTVKMKRVGQTQEKSDFLSRFIFYPRIPII